MTWIINKPEREELNPALSSDLDVARIGEEAARVLGYSLLKKTIAGRGALEIVLEELGIAPFNKESVHRYKTMMQLKASGKRAGRDHIYRAQWLTENINKYTQPIPEYVLAKALEIKEKLPAAEFLVESLIVNEVYVDPFLIVREGMSSYYIEVWDEPEFETL